jgi:hypothetical protein
MNFLKLTTTMFTESDEQDVVAKKEKLSPSLVDLLQKSDGNKQKSAPLRARFFA